MSGSFRNRRSSYETSFGSSLYRDNSDYLIGSNLDSLRASRYEVPKRTLSFRNYESEKFAKNSAKNDFVERLSNSSKFTKEYYPKSTLKISTQGNETPRRRRNSSSEFLIGAQHNDTGRKVSLESLNARIARKTSSLSSKSDDKIPPNINDSLSNFTTRHSRVPLTRRSSFNSDKVPTSALYCSETQSNSSSLRRTLSGRFSSALSSLSSRSTDESSLKARSSGEFLTMPPLSGNGLCGIRNVANSCYQNSVIQLLNAIPEFVNFLLNTTRGSLMSGKVSTEMIRLMKEFWNATDGDAIETGSLRSCLYRFDKKWMGYNQEDAHEFFTQIISALQEDYNRNVTKPKYLELKDHEDIKIQAMMEWKYSKQWNDSEVDDIFGFQLHNQIICPNCQCTSNRFEYVTSLEVSLPQYSTSLEDCLHEFMKAETLDKDNEWYCSECKTHVQAAKQLRISRCPKVLIICLKRFSSSSHVTSYFHSWKNKVSIAIPDGNVNLSKILSNTVDTTVLQRPEYELVGVVDHSGSVNFGHYTAKVKNIQNHDWYLMNDESVRRVGKPVGSSESAYMLALRQVNYS